ncbi:MAG: hypothetical protein HYX56_04190 [Chloroflexi bacterium]|nr:hypothetical protein [Chloroflexota bacterium]
MLRVVTVLIALVAVQIAFPAVAYACRAPNGQTYTPAGGDFANFTFGQQSQVGNQYYGVAGQMSTTFPPDPRYTDHPSEHVNSVMGSIDARTYAAWVFSGWVVGYSQVGGVSTATIFAEVNDSAGVSQVLSGAAPSTAWYKTQSIGQDGVTGKWRYGAYKHDGTNWIYMTEGQLTTSTTEAQVFGEATNPLLVGQTAGLCRKQSQPSSSDNAMASMQLFVDNSVWQNWEPAFGRSANFIDEQGYRRVSTRNYTDQAVGGCISC